jgi:putative FmdB family regulatory protein
MPIYEYECSKCGHHLEVMQKVSDKPLTKCPKCKASKLEKLISPPAFQFKGSGWYVTDYSGKGKAEKADKVDKAEKADKPEKADKTDKSEKKEKKEKAATDA